MKVKLGDICEIQSGGTPSRAVKEYWERGTISWVKISDFKEKYLLSTEEYISELGLENSSAKIFPAGTILYTIFATLGAVCILNINAATNQAIAGIQIKTNKLNKNYLYYFLLSMHSTVNNIGRGVAQNNINMTILKNIEISLPPLEEQQKIAAVLDNVSELIEKREQQLAKLDELIKSRFVEIFGDPVLNSYNFHVMKWDKIFNTKTGNLDSNASTNNGIYPFFTCSKEILKIDTYAFDQEALLLAGNNAAGKYDVKYYKGKFNAYQRTYVLTLKQNWSYILFRFQLENKLKLLEQLSLGGLTKYLTLKILNELEFIVPPLELQNQFADFVTQTEKTKTSIRTSLDKLKTLKKSLMQEYFN